MIAAKIEFDAYCVHGLATDCGGFVFQLEINHRRRLKRRRLLPLRQPLASISPVLSIRDS